MSTCPDCGCNSTKPLNDIMEFDHPIVVEADGTVHDHVPGVYAPELHMGTDDDGQILAGHEADYKADAARQGWQLLEGWTGQYSYNGPVMHPSEFVGGRLEDHIRETPGTYVAVVVSCDGDSEDEDQDAGWAVAYRPPPEGRDRWECGDCGDEITPGNDAGTDPLPRVHLNDGSPQCRGRLDAAKRYPARFPQDAARYGIPMPAGTVQVKRDGIVQETFAGPDPVKNSNDAFIWLLKHQGQSVDWAIKYEGWEITSPAPEGN